MCIGTVNALGMSVSERDNNGGWKESVLICEEMIGVQGGRG